MTKGKTRLSRGKKERFLRYVLRRNPCKYILLGNIAAIVLLSGCLGGLIWASMRYSKMNREYAMEDAILQKHWNNNYTFNHCLYKSPNPDWDTGFCADYCGPEAYAFRHYELEPDAANEKSCIDRMEVTMCHENFTRPCAKPRSGSDAIRACYGFQNVPMSSYLTEQVSNPDPIMVNAISNNHLQQYKGQMLLANELVLQCPQCRVLTVPFYFPDSTSHDKDTCYRVLETVEEGWPKFANYCDAVDMVFRSHGNGLPQNRLKRSFIPIADQIADMINEIMGEKHLQSDELPESHGDLQCVPVPLKQVE